MASPSPIQCLRLCLNIPFLVANSYTPMKGRQARMSGIDAVDPHARNHQMDLSNPLSHGEYCRR